MIFVFKFPLLSVSFGVVFKWPESWGCLGGEYSFYWVSISLSYSVIGSNSEWAYIYLWLSLILVESYSYELFSDSLIGCYFINSVSYLVSKFSVELVRFDLIIYYLCWSSKPCLNWQVELECFIIPGEIGLVILFYHTCPDPIAISKANFSASFFCLASNCLSRNFSIDFVFILL